MTTASPDAWHVPADVGTSLFRRTSASLVHNADIIRRKILQRRTEATTSLPAMKKMTHNMMPEKARPVWAASRLACVRLPIRIGAA